MTIPKVHLPHTKTILKAVVVLVAALAIVALTVAVVRQYRSNQQTLKQQHEAQLQAAYESGYKKGTSDRDTYTTAYQIVRVQCLKGKALYDSLPASTKRTVKAENVPTCPVL